jgi:two-component system, OmpR family, phosphate regulon sensor histidine kinase PhoR
MRDRGHRRIFFLLSFCALAILLLQAFWIRNFYLQERKRFESSVWSGLEKITAKLREREQLRVLREHNTQFAPGRVKVLATTPPGEATVDSVVMIRTEPSTKGAIMRKKVMTSRTSSVRQESFVFASGRDIKHTINVNSSTSEDGVLKTNYSYRTADGRDSASEKELTELFDKLLLEIRVFDRDEKNPDTLRSVIKRELASKGIFDPFEFSLRRNTGRNTRVIAQSPGFDTSAFSFRADLSANRVFSTGKYLELQFPQQQRILLSGIKGNLLLSLLFLAVLLSVFYYTIRLILKQKKLSDIKNDFVNNMTHELKTPIATISLAVDAMNNPLVRQDDEKYREYTRILREENSRLNSHVERVLQLAQIEKGELSIIRVRVDLADLTRQAISGFLLQAQSRNIRLVQEIPAEPLFMQGDPGHLRSAIANLLDNAIKYSATDTEIKISVQKLNNELLVKVKDQGKGITREEQPKIFEKFYRVSQGSLHDVKGFGLGLSYVRSIAEAHGGAIGMVSEPGVGSEFIIRFPVSP